MTAVPAYPLAWPASWKRTPEHKRAHGRFGKQTTRYAGSGENSWSYKSKGEVTIAEGVSRIRVELARMGVSDDDLVISTNLQLRLDGFPKSAQRQPADPGAAVYWRDGREQRCMAIDRYHLVEHNLAAIAATLDAMRAIERHGGAEILNRAFTGFTALGHESGRRWWDVLGVASDAGPLVIIDAYKRRRSATHPDRGGDAAEFAAVEQAYQQAIEQGAR